MHVHRYRGFVFAIALTLALGPIAGTAMGQLAATGLAEDGPDSWEQETKVLPDTAGARMGEDVAADGGLFLVGAPVENAVYAYERTDDGLERRPFPAAPDSASGAFGASVDIDGDRAIVGASGTISGSSNDAGTAFVFEFTALDEWVQVATLTPPPDADDEMRNFGQSVAIDAETSTALVGTPEEDTSAGESAGAAYVFDGQDDAWTLEATLTATNAEADEEFGSAVALEGTTAIVGAPMDAAAGSEAFLSLPGGFGVPIPAGAAYVFQGSNAGWTQTAQLVGSQPLEDLGFGGTVALDGPRALIGSANAGYVFDGLPADPNEQARLEPDDRVTDDSLTPNPAAYTFEDVALDGERALIGARAPLSFQPGGKAFVFEQGDEGAWSQATELEQRDPESHAVSAGDNPNFGVAVALDGDRAIVGASFEDSIQGQRDGGAAYVFAPCTEEGPLSGPVHENVEPATGPAQEDVHDVNCNVIASNGG